MLACYVILHVQSSPHILGEHVELDELEHQRQHADDAGDDNAKPRPPRMADDPAKALGIRTRQPRNECAAFLRFRQPNTCREHRNERLCNKERSQECDDNRHRHVRQKDHDIVLGADNDRCEYDDGCRGPCDNRRPDLAHTVQRCVEGLLLVHRPMPENAFGDDDRIVDEHADGEH